MAAASISVMRLALLLVMAACVCAQVPGANTIISPTDGTRWRPGHEIEIQWVPQGPTADSQTVKLELMSGDDPTHLQKAYMIAANVKRQQSTIAWTVPEDIKQGSNYVLRIVPDDGTFPNYSHMFAVAAGPSRASDAPKPSGKLVGVSKASSQTSASEITHVSAKEKESSSAAKAAESSGESTAEPASDSGASKTQPSVPSTGSSKSTSAVHVSGSSRRFHAYTRPTELAAVVAGSGALSIRVGLAVLVLMLATWIL